MYQNISGDGTNRVMQNILFICSRNQWRSPTAEKVFLKNSDCHVRSEGTSPSARRRVSQSDIRWADRIYVMEEKHKSRLKADFRQDLRHADIRVLDIPDDYGFMDPELVQIFEDLADQL